MFSTCIAERMSTTNGFHIFSISIYMSSDLDLSQHLEHIDMNTWTNLMVLKPIIDLDHIVRKLVGRAVLLDERVPIHLISQKFKLPIW